MTTDPFDFSGMMKMFDPSEIMKAFNPEHMRSVFENVTIPSVDINAVLDSNRKNFEAVKAANGMAAATYQDLHSRQMAIFQTMMDAAKEASQALAGPDAPTKQAEIYRKAMESALASMTELAEQARIANEKAAAIIQARVDDAAKELKSG